MANRPQNGRLDRQLWAGHDLICIGASAGGVEALTYLISTLPPDLPAAIFVVLHLPTNGSSLLPTILNRRSQLPASHPRDGQQIQHGKVYIAPPDYHLLVHDGQIRVSHGPRENGHRPAVDATFRSAAIAYGPRAVGVVLTGTLDDGTAGLLAIKARGGVAVVQHPDDAMFPGMPRSAVENVRVDLVLPLTEIPAALAELARTPPEPPVREANRAMAQESAMMELEPGAVQELERPGTASGYTCPECKGALWEFQENNLVRFRCRVGHGYSADSLMAAQSQRLEAALYGALDVLKEKESLARRLTQRAHERGHHLAAQRFELQADDARAHAETIRRALLEGQEMVIAPDAIADEDAEEEARREMAPGDGAGQLTPDR